MKQMFNSFINWKAGEFFSSPIFNENTVLSEGTSIPLVSKNCLISWNSDNIEFSIKGNKLIELKISDVTIDMIISLMNELEKMPVNDFKEIYLKMNVKVFHAPAVYRTWAKTGFLFDNGWYFCEYFYYNRPTLFFANQCNGLSGKNQFERVDKDPEFPNFEGYQPFNYTGKDKDIKLDFVDYVKELKGKGLFDVNSDKFKELEIDLEKEIQRTKSDTPRIKENEIKEVENAEIEKSKKEFSLTYAEIENFRTIENERFNLKPLTIVTGKNSSGKSSILKALMLLQHLEFDYENSLDFFIDNRKAPYNLDFSTFKNNDENNFISIGVNFDFRLKKFEHDPLKINFTFFNKTEEQRLVLKSICVNFISIRDEFECVFEIQKNDTTYNLKIGKHAFSTSNTEAYTKHEFDRKTNELFDLLLFDDKGLGVYLINVLKGNEKLKDEIDEIDENNEFTDFLAEFRYLKHEKISKQLQYIPSIRSQLVREHATNSFSGMILEKIHQYEKNNNTVEFQNLISKYFVEFGFINPDKTKESKTYQIDEPTIKNEYTLRIDDKNIADLGFGYNQLFPVIFMSVYAHISGKNIVFIEEPESNLHPNLQSKLADFFVEVNDKFGTQFIIETHSEYFIRRLQVLCKQKLKENSKNIVIHYIDQESDTQNNKKGNLVINIDEDGYLSEPFGEGFFDESIKNITQLN